MEADRPGPLLDHCRRSPSGWEDAGCRSEGWARGKYFNVWFENEIKPLFLCSKPKVISHGTRTLECLLERETEARGRDLPQVSWVTL